MQSVLGGRGTLYGLLLRTGLRALLRTDTTLSRTGQIVVLASGQEVSFNILPKGGLV